jgi:hypothetical protein
MNWHATATLLSRIAFDESGGMAGSFPARLLELTSNDLFLAFSPS